METESTGVKDEFSGEGWRAWEVPQWAPRALAGTVGTSELTTALEGTVSQQVILLAVWGRIFLQGLNLQVTPSLLTGSSQRRLASPWGTGQFEVQH